MKKLFLIPLIYLLITTSIAYSYSIPNTNQILYRVSSIDTLYPDYLDVRDTTSISKIDTLIVTLQDSFTVTNANLDTIKNVLRDSLTATNTELDTIKQVLRDSLSAISNDITTFEQTYKDSSNVIISKLDTVIITLQDSLTAANAELDTIKQVLRDSLNVISTDIQTLEQTFKDSINLVLQDNDSIIQILRDSLTTISNDITTFEQTFKDSIALITAKLDSAGINPTPVYLDSVDTNLIELTEGNIIYSVDINNLEGGSEAFLQLFAADSLAAITLGTTLPDFEMPVLAFGLTGRSYPAGLDFSNKGSKLYIAVTGTAGGNDAPNNSVKISFSIKR